MLLNNGDAESDMAADESDAGSDMELGSDNEDDDGQSDAGSDMGAESDVGSEADLAAESDMESDMGSDDDAQSDVASELGAWDLGIESDIESDGDDAMSDMDDAQSDMGSVAEPGGEAQGDWDGEGGFVSAAEYAMYWANVEGLMGADADMGGEVVKGGVKENNDTTGETTCISCTCNVSAHGEDSNVGPTSSKQAKASKQRCCTCVLVSASMLMHVCVCLCAGEGAVAPKSRRTTVEVMAVGTSFIVQPNQGRRRATVCETEVSICTSPVRTACCMCPVCHVWSCSLLMCAT